MRPSKRTGTFSTGTCSPRMGWWIVPRTISPVWRRRDTSHHWDSLTVWPTRSWSTRVGRLFGRICPSTTSSGSLVVGCSGRARTGTSRRGRESEVGQHAPKPKQALQVLELLGLEVGVALGEVGRGRHGFRPPAPARRRPPGGGRKPVSPGGDGARPRPRRHAGRRPGPPRVREVGVRRGGQRDAPRHEASEQRTGVLLAHRLAPAGQETSAAMPDASAASAMRSHHSAGASGTWPAALIGRDGPARRHPRAASSSRAAVYASQQASTCRSYHSAIESGSHRSSKRQAPTQCTDPRSTSKGSPQGGGHSVHPVHVVVDLQADDDPAGRPPWPRGRTPRRPRGRRWRGTPSTRPWTRPGPAARVGRPRSRRAARGLAEPEEVLRSSRRAP